MAKKRTRRVWTVGDLRARNFGQDVHQLCYVCGETYSAAAGDYFGANESTVLKCCNKPIVLVTSRRVNTEVR